MALLTDQSIAVEFAVFVVVHLDTRLVVIDTLCNDTKAGEACEELIFVNIVRQRRDVDGGVDTLARLLVLLLLRVFLQIVSNGTRKDKLRSVTTLYTYIFSLQSLALFARIKCRLVVINAWHLVRCTLLLCKRFIHLYHEKSRNVRVSPRPMSCNSFGIRRQKPADWFRFEDGVLQRGLRTMGTHFELRGNHSHSSPFSSSRV